MMMTNASAPWHKQSFDSFLNDRLLGLLSERLPLAGYEVQPIDDHSCRPTVSIAAESGRAQVAYENVPLPDEDGVFEIDGARFVVVPTASREELDEACIRCVGEQLYDFIEARLGEAPAAMPWEASLVRSFLPLDSWIAEFFSGPTAQQLDEQNWLSRQAHLRRIMIPDRRKLIAPGQFGRTCPFETPGGENAGRVLSLAVGAAIRDGRLRIIDDRPAAALGLTASMVPFLEHNDPNRQRIGVNMMRQSIVPPESEPACVQTGNEPDAADFWCGRDLLTAFVSWGPETYEDSLALSESAAARLDYPHALEVGDKLTNRHGQMGTVGRIIPDNEMPHLPDGTPVELICSFLGVHARLNFGQIREAIMGRIAHAEGEPAIVPPFGAPSDEQLRDRLAKANLPASGMETLTVGRDGPKLGSPSTVGWVYWSKSRHVARDKIHASVTRERCNIQGELEYYQLRDVGAFETIAETYNTRSVDRVDAESLPKRVAAGTVEQASPPSPKFAELVRRLDLAGIQVELSDEKLSFALAASRADKIELACPVAHPWLREREITSIGACENNSLNEAVIEANRRMASIGQGPKTLHENALKQLQQRVDEWFGELLLDFGANAPVQWTGLLQFGNGVAFSGRTVISPGLDLGIDQVGLADEIAWTLFAPLVARELGDETEAQGRTARAAEMLDRIMAESWVIVNRAPSFMPTCLLAFRPVRIPENVIRLHPLATYMMDADFDGDQVAVFLPITQAAQREAAERLSVAGHLRRDGGLLKWITPKHEALWGLAFLSLTPPGRKEIRDLAGVDIDRPDGYVDRDSLARAMQAVLIERGVEHVLAVMDKLATRGLEAARASGASLAPFPAAGLDGPAAPAGDDVDEWDAYAAELAERIASRRDFDAEDLGAQLLAVKSGARGGIAHLARLLGARGAVRPFEPDNGELASSRCVVVRNGLAAGLRPAEMWACAATARQALGQTALQCARQGYGLRQAQQTKAFTVLARAMRSERPGTVFASAAAIGEVDPLTDLDSRLFVGLEPIL